MEIILYEEGKVTENEISESARKITAACKNGELLIFCCDTGDLVKKSFDDSGIEYWMIINKENVYKLSLLLQVYSYNLDEGILAALKNKFTGRSCYFDLMDFFEKSGIKYKATLWR